MNRIKTLQFILLLFSHVAFSQLSNKSNQKSTSNVDKGHYCATDKLNSDLINQSTSYKNKLDKMNEHWQKFAIEKANLMYNSKQNGNANSTQAFYQSETLPVVFHKMINGTSSPITSSITKPQLQAALAVLNQIYAGTATGSKPAGINTDIQFCLSEVDALGSPITSYTYTNPTTLPLDNTNQGQITTLSNAVQTTGKFPPTKYINIYIVEDITSPVAGFAYMPPAHGSSFDGIYIEAQYLLPATSPNDLAYNTTVLTHEMGHYLGLFHTFGICNPGPGLILPSQNCSCDNNNCLFNGDMVCDTPPDFSALSTTTNCAAVNTCTTDAAYTISAAPALTSDVPDLISNYMDYGDWNCQHSFTQGQINRMHFMIDEADGPRNSLLHSSACNTLCVNNTCTLSITSPTAVVNGVSIPNTLILSGASISYTFAGIVCSGIYNTVNWSLVDLSTNSIVATGTNTSFPTTYTAIGNYRIVLSASISGSNPLCSQTTSINIQVLPPASCPTNLDMSNGWTQNWERIQYEGGWARTTNNGSTFTFPTTTFTIHPTTYANGLTNGDPFRMTSSFSDPNFPSITTLPTGITNIMRVGRLITPTTSLPAGDAAYVTYTFSPTQANAKLRVWYLGMQEKDAVSSIAYGNSFATAPSGCKTNFGFVCNYDFTSVSSPPNIAHRGMTHTGSSSYTFPKNDMIPGYVNSPITSTLAIGTRTMEAMNAWGYMDLDFSEFICASPTITITFFARSDNALNPGFHHSYAYFGATCLPGLFKDIDLNLQNKDIACMADVAQSCVNVNLAPPNNYTFNQSGNIYSDLLDVDLEESNDGITYTVVPSLPAGSNITTANPPFLNLCKSPDNNPYKYYRVTYNTLCQTITNTLTIFQGFVHTINDCSSSPMSGGSFISAPIPIGTQTVSPDKYVQYCGTTTLSLTPPCWWQTGDPPPIYQWQIFNGSWSNLPGETNPTLVLNGSNNDICKQYRRRAQYHDMYCNNDIWIASDVFSVTSLTSSNFTYIPLGPDVCINDPATVNLNNFYEWGPFNVCDIELAAQTNTATGTPVTNTVSFSFFSSSNCIPSNSITAIGANPSVLTYTYVNSILSTTPLNISYTFNNTMFTTNNNVRVVVEFNRYGCTSTFTLNVPIKVKASAIAGTITTNSCLTPTISITGDNPNSTGYYWEYSYNSTFTPTLSLTSSTLSSVSIPSSMFTAYPVYIRRVANGTTDCPNPAYSNTLTILNNSVNISVSASSTVCAGTSVTLTASGTTSYTWSPGGATTATVAVTPTTTTIYTVTGTNTSGCTDTKTVSITVNPKPTVNISASSTTLCVGKTVTLTASGASTYSWSTGASTNSISVSPTSNTIYTATGTNSLGCTASKTIAISVISGISFSVTAAPSTICSGNCSTLTASGVNSYTWLPANTTGSTAVVCPTTTTSYSVLGFKNGSQCPSLASITVSVLASPSVTIVGTMSICPGNSTTLTASGGGTYSWSPGGASTASITTNMTGAYTVTVTGTNGCKTIKTATVGSYPNSTFTVTPTSASICPGDNFTFTGSLIPVTAYTWTPGGITTYTANFSPTTTTIYTVTGKNKGTACPTTKTVTLTVLPTPTVTISGELQICPGTSTTLTATGGAYYSWSTGASTNSTSVNVSGPVSVTVTGVNGCGTVATTTVTSGSTSNISITPATSTICAGSGACVTLSTTAATHTWAPGGSTLSSVTVCPTSTTVYTLTGSKSAGECNGTATATVYVVASPTANITGNLTICYNTTTLTATGGGTYSWSPSGATTSTIAVNTTGVITVTVTSANGCTSVKSVTITQPGPPLCYNPAKVINNNDNPKTITDVSHVIYPNPANQSFSISNSEEISELEIFDYTGKLLRHINRDNDDASFENIDIKYYNSGIYMIRLINNNNTIELFKLIKE